MKYLYKNLPKVKIKTWTCSIKRPTYRLLTGMHNYSLSTRTRKGNCKLSYVRPSIGLTDQFGIYSLYEMYTLHSICQLFPWGKKEPKKYIGHKLNIVSQLVGWLVSRLVLGLDWTCEIMNQFINRLKTFCKFLTLNPL